MKVPNYKLSSGGIKEKVQNKNKGMELRLTFQRGFDFGNYKAFSYEKFGRRRTSEKNFKVVKRCRMASFGKMCLNTGWSRNSTFFTSKGRDFQTT